MVILFVYLVLCVGMLDNFKLLLGYKLGWARYKR